MAGYPKSLGVLVIAIVAALLPGCEKPAPPSAAASLAKPIPFGGGPADQGDRITFFDSDAFDVDLSEAMASNAKTVEVVFAGPVSINQLPPRVNTWLAAVKRTDGNVVAKAPPPPGTRGPAVEIVFAVIDLIKSLWERQQATSRLEQTRNYNAEIQFDATTGVARGVVFRKRGDTT